MSDKFLSTENRDSNPLLAVVIPVYRSLNFVKPQVDSLIGQLAGHQDRELILACNNPARFLDDDFLSYVLALRSSGVEVSVVDATERAGVSFARNVGWHSTEADFVLFCDDDDVVSENWIREMYAKLQLFDMVGGRLDYNLLNEARLASLFRNQRSEFPTKFSHLPFMTGCNVGVRRKVLLDTNGFDEEMTAPQDIDFSWRAQYLGFTLGYSESAVVHYRLRPTAKLLFQQAFFYGRSDSLLLKKHAVMGAKRKLSESLVDFVSTIVSIVMSPFSATRRSKAAIRTGSFLGRFVATIGDRVWVL